MRNTKHRVKAEVAHSEETVAVVEKLILGQEGRPQTFCLIHQIRETERQVHTAISV